MHKQTASIMGTPPMHAGSVSPDIDPLAPAEGLRSPLEAARFAPRQINRLVRLWLIREGDLPTVHFRQLRLEAPTRRPYRLRKRGSR